MKYENQKDIDKIPSSYLVLNIASSNRKIKHNNLKKLELLPDSNIKTVGKRYKEKDKYNHKLMTDYKESITVIANYLINHSHNQSVVIICKKGEWSINLAKLICKYIEKRYEYKSYKFTNTVVKDMRENSKFTQEGLTRLVKDMNAVRKLL